MKKLSSILLDISLNKMNWGVL